MNATLTGIGLMTALAVLVAGCGLVTGTGAHATSTGSAAHVTGITLA